VSEKFIDTHNHQCRSSKKNQESESFTETDLCAPVQVHVAKEDIRYAFEAEKEQREQEER
jgi:hypothetical protein